MSICKRLNPNVEVPDIVDLIQQIDEMLESDKTERIVTNTEDTPSVSIKYSFSLRNVLALLYKTL